MAGVAVPFLILAVLASVVLRFRRSRGEERQQLKWFTFVVAADLALIPGLGAVTEQVAPVLGELVVFPATISLIPIAIGVAVLKYRLYDIDRVINRTLVYGLLTVLLGAVPRWRVRPRSAPQPGRWGISLAVAASTLAAAALFQPARRRIQAVMDRRFNRCKYNAAKTIEAFSVRLRDEVDLDALGGAAGRRRPNHAANNGVPMAPASATACAAWSMTSCMPCSFGLLPTPGQGPRTAQRSFLSDRD